MDKVKDKQAIIDEVYHLPNGFGSMQQTLKDAKKKYKSITLEDVQVYFKNNIAPTTQLRGENSFIANAPHQEYEADLFFFTKPENAEYKIGLLVVDIFTKLVSVILLKGKSPDIVEPALERAFKNLG